MLDWARRNSSAGRFPRDYEKAIPISLHPKHYERVITACCFLFLFVNIGLPSTSFSVYQPYLVSLPAVGDTGGSLILSARTLTSFAAMFLVGAYLNRLDVRAGAAVGCFLTGAGFIVYSFAASLPVFLFAAVLTGLGYGLGGMVGMTLLMNRWYKSRVATSIGIATVGSGVASIVMPIVILPIIHALSLQMAFRFEAAIAIVFGIVVFVFLRNHPDDIGAEPFHSPEGPEHKPGSKAHDVDLDMLTPLPAHMRTLLLAAMVITGAFCLGGMSYLSVNLTSVGFDAVFAGTMVSVAGAALTVSKFTAGEVIDHAGPRKGTFMLFSVLIVGTVLCCLPFLHNYALSAVGTALYGFGTSIGSVGISLWALELSDAKHRTRTVRNYQICYSLGGFLFNLFPGVLMEATGSYAVIYVILLVCGVLAAAIILHAYRCYRPEMG